MTNEFQIDRALHAAAESRVSWLLLSGEDVVCWLSGVITPIESGPSPFRGGPPVVLLGAKSRAPIAVTANSDAPSDPADEVVTYRGVSAAGPEPILDNYLDAIESAINMAGVSGVVGVDLRTLSAPVDRLLRRRGLDVVDVGLAIDKARSIKSDAEIGLLRASARIASVAHSAVLRTARAGGTELGLFSALRRESEAAAGARLAFAGDLVSGIKRTAGIGGWPSNRAMRLNDPVIADLAPRVDGYWADSCNSFVVGDATSAYARIHDEVRSALCLGVRTAGPGIPANVVDQTMREHLAQQGLSYPHHSGHGIGTSVHEWPRIIPGESAALEAGMVILLEPGAYVPGIGGVRLEHMFLVRDDGLEQLTSFPMELTVDGALSKKGLLADVVRRRI